MKSPFVKMKRLTMAQQQKLSILSNEVIRRLSNTNRKRQEKMETKIMVEQFTKELKVSGYTRVEAR